MTREPLSAQGRHSLSSVLGLWSLASSPYSRASLPAEACLRGWSCL